MARHKKPTVYKRSKQRQRILEVLGSTDTHPTADWIYAKLKKEFPSLSMGTVYRNLTILQEQGLINKIHFGSTHDRFEAHVEPHYHLVCQQCSSIQDFEMSGYEELNKKAGRMTDFQIQRHRIDFFGICGKCSAKSKRQ
jgi:Fur family peroxide stress response transcriptional regulator